MKKSFFIGILFLISFLTGAAWTLLPSTSKEFVEVHQLLSNYQYGVGAGFVTLGAILSSLVLSIAGNVIEGKRTVQIGLGMMFLSLAAMAIVAEVPTDRLFPFFMGAALMLGGGIGALIISLSASILYVVKEKKASAIIALYIFTGFGSSLLPAAILQLEEQVTLQVITATLSGLFFLLFLLVRFSKRFESLQFESVLSVSKHFPLTYFVLFCSIGFVYGCFEVVIDNFTPIFLDQAKELPRRQGNMGLSIFWAFVTLGEVFFAVCMYWVQSKWVYVALPCMMTVATLLLQLPITSYFEIALYFGILGLSVSAFYPLTLRFAKADIPGKEVSAFGVIFCSYLVGASLNSVFVGFLESSTSIKIGIIFSLLPILTLLLLFLTVLVVVRHKKQV